MPMSGLGGRPRNPGPATLAPSAGMPRMPCSVLATSSGSAYCMRIVSSRRGPFASCSRWAASAASLRWTASASLTWASASFARTSASPFSFASSTRARASRSLVSCSVETMRITPPRSTFSRPRALRMVSSASSQGTLRSAIDILPFTSSPMTMLRPLSAARMRSRLMTSASLKSSEMRCGPPVAAGGGTTGVGAGAGACA